MARLCDVCWRNAENTVSKCPALKMSTENRQEVCD